MSLKIIFAGTPDFALPSLNALIASSHEVAAVLTQPDRRAGRGQLLQATPAKQLAEAHNLPIFQPNSLRDATVQKKIRECKADVMVVVAYGLLLPETVLSIPRLGCVNIHPSLLPKWRGAAPIQRSIEAGDVETGVTIMQLDKGMDSVPILLQEKIKLKGNETSEMLHDRLSQLGATLLLKTIDALEKNTIKAVAQEDSKATFAEKIQKSEAMIDWQQSAEKIAQKVRAFNPWPVAQTVFLHQPLKIWDACAIPKKNNAKPGVLISMNKDHFSVATADGALQILSVQMPGKKRLSAADFMHGFSSQLTINQTLFA